MSDMNQAHSAENDARKNLMQNERGEWVPAIPEPLYHRFRAHCDCGETRWTRGGYREHYALAHILGVGR